MALVTQVLFIGTTPGVKDIVRSELLCLECQMISATSIALGLFLARKNFPELIICEPELADGEGLEFLREIKQDPELCGLPVVFMSTKLSDPTFRAQAVAMGAEKFVSCVYDWQNFLEEIKQYLQKANKLRAPETPE